MKLAKYVAAGSIALAVLSSVALAAEPRNGTVTRIDRTTGTIAIQPTQDGTVGTSGSASEGFKVKEGAWLDTLHAGDRITFSVNDGDGKTITKLEKR